MSIPDAYRTAVAQLKAGQLREAETGCQAILATQPDQPETWHLLGLIALNSNEYAKASECIQRAITLSPLSATFQANLGEVHRRQGQVDHAINCYRRAIELNPTFVEAHNNLAMLLIRRDQAASIEHLRRALAINASFTPALENLANALLVRGDRAAAADAFERFVRGNPTHTEGWLKLGAMRFQLGKIEEAIQCFRRILQLDPSHAKAHNHLGGALRQIGQRQAAASSFRDAIAADPQLPEAHFNLGVVLLELGDTSGGELALANSLRVKPDFVEPLTALGNRLLASGRLDEAMGYYDRAIAANPQLAMAHFNRANVLQIQNRSVEALAAYEQALALDANPETYNNLALLLSDIERPDEAVEACHKGLALDPDHGFLHSILAKSLESQGRVEEAIAARRRAVELVPSSAAEGSNLLYTLNFSDVWEPPQVFAEHLRWAKQHAEPLTAKAARHTNDRTVSRRLRIGYVSAFFRRHAVNFFMEPVLLAHDHERFEIVCYSDLHVADETTARLKQAADVWRDIAFVGDEQVAELVREDQIDILVDLAGHIGGNRLLVFARKPAPVQVTYLGYQATTGMSAMDYRLTDERADPPGMTEAFHTEALFRLPRAFFCYQPLDDAPDVGPLPATTCGHITFGSFNNFIKVSPAAIEAWIRILERVADSRLLVLAGRGGYVEQRIQSAAAERGLAPERIEVVEKRPHREYMALLGQADIALDPFPFNGHTTTCDSLWMGVPVVMLEGNTYATRFGGSVLANLGLEAWIARDVDRYVNVAVDWARQPQALADLRAALRARMKASALMDYAGFTRNLENAYREMWRRWCEGADAR